MLTYIVIYPSYELGGNSAVNIVGIVRITYNIYDGIDVTLSVTLLLIVLW